MLATEEQVCSKKFCVDYIFYFIFIFVFYFCVDPTGCVTSNSEWMWLQIMKVWKEVLLVSFKVASIPTSAWTPLPLQEPEINYLILQLCFCSSARCTLTTMSPCWILCCRSMWTILMSSHTCQHCVVTSSGLVKSSIPYVRPKHQGFRESIN
jgi:hypothetical protein